MCYCKMLAQEQRQNLHVTANSAKERFSKEMKLGKRTNTGRCAPKTDLDKQGLRGGPGSVLYWEPREDKG